MPRAERLSSRGISPLTGVLRQKTQNGERTIILKEEGFFREDDPLILSFEVKPFGDEDPDIVLANCKRALNRAWATV